MKLPINMKLTRNRWHEVANGKWVYVDEDGRITRAMKSDNNGGRVSAAIYKANRYGTLTNVLPCTRQELRKEGVVII